MIDLYCAFVLTDSFEKAVEELPHGAIKKAIVLYGIGDSLARSENGKFFYDFEEGNLIEPEIKELLSELEDSEYRLAYLAICDVAIAYEKWANEQRNENEEESD